MAQTGQPDGFLVGCESTMNRDRLVAEFEVAGDGIVLFLGQQPPAEGHRWLLAGGPTSDNVTAAIHAIFPWGVDVSSGVKAPLITRFVTTAKSA